jgi:hypothetical protein
MDMFQQGAELARKTMLQESEEMREANITLMMAKYSIDHESAETTNEIPEMLSELWFLVDAPRHNRIFTFTSTRVEDFDVLFTPVDDETVYRESDGSLSSVPGVPLVKYVPIDVVRDLRATLVEEPVTANDAVKTASIRNLFEHLIAAINADPSLNVHIDEDNAEVMWMLSEAARPANAAQHEALKAAMLSLSD